MWPWGHLAVGYLLYSLLVRVRHRRPPGGYAAIALALGTQFPDLVDKPLAWTVGVLPNGRSLTHSLPIALLVLAVLVVALRRRGREPLAAAFGVGYLSHLLGDALSPALAGDLYALGFLAWPLVPPVEYSTEQSFVAHLSQLALTPSVASELLLGALVLLLWLVDGSPGLGVVREPPRWLSRRLSA